MWRKKIEMLEWVAYVRMLNIVAGEKVEKVSMEKREREWFLSKKRKNTDKKAA